MATKRAKGTAPPVRLVVRHGLRAVPADIPREPKHWLRIARAYLLGLRVKDKGAHYRPMVRRINANWHTVARALDGLADKFTRYRKARKQAGGDVDGAEAACHVALVFESFAWWAAEEADRIEAIRYAAQDLENLQGRIARTAEELLNLIAEAEDLAHRHRLEVFGPAWVQDLDDVLQDLAHRFPRWGQGGEVARLIESRRELVNDRPKMTDAIESAMSVGMLSAGLSNPVRHFATGKWLRTVGPEVVADGWLSAEALRIRSGSGGKAAAARLRVLFAGLETLTESYATGNKDESPVQWLTARQIAELCNVFTGDDAMTAETVDKARRAYLRDQDTPG